MICAICSKIYKEAQKENPTLSVTEFSGSPVGMIANMIVNGTSYCDKHNPELLTQSLKKDL